MKNEFHLIRMPGEPERAIEVHPRSFSVPRSARPKTIETRTLTVNPCATVPKAVRFKIASFDPDWKAPMRPFPEIHERPKRKVTDLIPRLKADVNSPREPWTNGFALQDETDTLKYDAAVNPESDFLQFHFGTLLREQSFSFCVENRLRRQFDFHLMTRCGVLAAHPTGDSEFLPLS
jgi:hypothetical protein